MTARTEQQPKKRPSHRVADINLPRKAWTVVEVAAQLGIGYEAVLDLLIKTGVLGHQRAGRHILVPAAELDRYLADLQRGDPAA